MRYALASKMVHGVRFFFPIITHSNGWTSCMAGPSAEHSKYVVTASPHGNLRKRPLLIVPTLQMRTETWQS